MSTYVHVQSAQFRIQYLVISYCYCCCQPSRVAPPLEDLEVGMNDAYGKRHKDAANFQPCDMYYIIFIILAYKDEIINVLEGT